MGSWDNWKLAGSPKFCFDKAPSAASPTSKGNVKGEHFLILKISETKFQKNLQLKQEKKLEMILPGSLTTIKPVANPEPVKVSARTTVNFNLENVIKTFEECIIECTEFQLWLFSFRTLLLKSLMFKPIVCKFSTP